MRGQYATHTIEVIARAIIIHDGHILLCRQKNADNYFFPGGHVEFDEDSPTALRREIKEETDADVTTTRFIGIVENRFNQHDAEKHEINIVFEAHLTSPEIQDMEDHIECAWVSLEEFQKGNVLPVILKDTVIRWVGDKQIFFGNEDSIH